MEVIARVVRGRRMPVLLGLVAALPIIVGAIRAVADHWAPYGDRAVIALRSYDVLSAHSPTVGQYTQWSAVLGRPIFSPGPLLYWLLTIPAHISATWALPAWIAVVNVLCVIGIVILAHRRGGLWLAAATALALPLMFRSLPSETFHDIWNPSAALLPFLLTCFTGWSVACGDLRLAPLLVLLLSFIVETHLTFAAPGLGILIVAAAGLWAARREHSRSDLRRWLGASVVVAIVCWAPPVIDQLNGGGNLRSLYDAVRAAHGSLGAGDGWHAAVRAFGIPPWWLGPPISDLGRLGDVTHSPGWLSQLTMVLEVVLLVVMFVRGLRGRRASAALAAICLVLIATLAAGTASTPTQDNLFLTVGYTLWWASPAGLFVWLGIGYLVIPELQLERVIAKRTAWAAAALVPAGAVAALIVTAVQPADQDRGEYASFGTAAAKTAAATPHGGTVLVAASPWFPGSELQYELVYALRADGLQVLVPPADAGELGKQYAHQGRGTMTTRLNVTYGHLRSMGARTVTRIRVRPPSPIRPGTFTITAEVGGSAHASNGSSD